MKKTLSVFLIALLPGCSAMTHKGERHQVIPYYGASLVLGKERTTLLDTGANISSVRLGYEKGDGYVLVEGEKLTVKRSGSFIGVNTTKTKPVIELTVKIHGCLAKGEFTVSTYDARTPDILLGRNILKQCNLLIDSS